MARRDAQSRSEAASKRSAGKKEVAEVTPFPIYICPAEFACFKSATKIREIVTRFHVGCRGAPCSAHGAPSLTALPQMKAAEMEVREVTMSSADGSPTLSACGTGSMSPPYQSLGSSSGESPFFTPDRPAYAENKPAHIKQEDMPAEGPSAMSCDEENSSPKNPALSMAFHESPAKDSQAAEAKQADAELGVGYSRVGGVDWVVRRKNETQNRAYRAGMTAKELQVCPRFPVIFCQTPPGAVPSPLTPPASDRAGLQGREEAQRRDPGAVQAPLSRRDSEVRGG